MQFDRLGHSVALLYPQPEGENAFITYQYFDLYFKKSLQLAFAIQVARSSNCTYLRCTSTRFYREIWELLNFVPCNPLSNKLSSSKTKSICYKGKCIPEKKNQGKAGSWSSWSSLSKCQGDDTIGFAQRTRKCNNPWPKFGGRYCQGAKIKYEVCQNAFSKNNKKNQALCTEYDNSSIYTELDNKPCFLYCYFKHNNSVANIGKAVDGTIVRMENSMDMFFNGDIIFTLCVNLNTLKKSFFGTSSASKCTIQPQRRCSHPRRHSVNYQI
ncbi:A disintegrin and metalloproteinase with thrombospondin motifs 3-like [Gordionus sp. m RMFG-2023]|uniref:A disintegrin and metalloproteinase with thrombospondin motifs 3-like n=1 Tax=Gordionus sp. m RMFG-2023 TaxID=3053472 RepID=UPI0031FC336B